MNAIASQIAQDKIIAISVQAQLSRIPIIAEPTLPTGGSGPTPGIGRIGQLPAKTVIWGAEMAARDRSFAACGNLAKQMVKMHETIDESSNQGIPLPSR